MCVAALSGVQAIVEGCSPKRDNLAKDSQLFA